VLERAKVSRKFSTNFSQVRSRVTEGTIEPAMRPLSFLTDVEALI
jgi:hypothetical protein